MKTLITALFLALLLVTGAQAAGSRTIQVWDGTNVRVNDNIICVVGKGSIICGLRGVKRSNYSAFLSGEGAAVSGRGRTQLLCMHGYVCETP